MSFEGYYDYSCPRGHIDGGYDVYDDYVPLTCFKCGRPLSSVRKVDCTNGRAEPMAWSSIPTNGLPVED